MERDPYIVFTYHRLFESVQSWIPLPKGIAFPSWTTLCLIAPSGFPDQPLKVFSALLPAPREEGEVKLLDSIRLWNNKPPAFAVLRIAKMRFRELSHWSPLTFQHFASQDWNTDLVFWVSVTAPREQNSSFGRDVFSTCLLLRAKCCKQPRLAGMHSTWGCLQDTLTWPKALARSVTSCVYTWDPCMVFLCSFAQMLAQKLLSSMLLKNQGQSLQMALLTLWSAGSHSLGIIFTCLPVGCCWIQMFSNPANSSAH